MVGSEKVVIESEKITAQQIEHGEANTELNADELLLQQLGYKQVFYLFIYIDQKPNESITHT